jgi:hypothetical protein
MASYNAGFLAFFSPVNLQEKCSYLEDVLENDCSTDRQDLTSARSPDLERQRKRTCPAFGKSLSMCANAVRFCKKKAW